MKNTIRIFCLLSVCFGVSACGNEYTITFNTFKEICEFSGGTYNGDNDDNIGKCKCDNNTECNPGVACINGKCADYKEIIYKYCRDEIDQKCENDTIFNCKDGRWNKTEETCQKGCTPDGRLCVKCENTDTKCINNIEQHCENGLFVDAIQCGENGCLSDQSKCAECKSTETQCASANSFRTCVEGKWSSETDNCTDDKPYCSEGKCVISGCKDGETICTDHTLLKCENNTWSTEPCNKGCISSTNSCANCNEDDIKCEGTKITNCLNGVLNTTQCIDSQKNSVSCLDNKTCGGCKNDQTKCEGNVQYTCTDGKWDEGKNCPDGCENDKCNETLEKCKDSDKSTCDGDSIKTCQGGVWTTIKCPNGCKNDKCIETSNKCDDSDGPKCIPNSDGSGQMQICTNGSWVLAHDCLNDSKQPVSCKNITECGECKNDDMRCINNDKIGQKQVCKDGSWVLDHDCSNDSKQPVSCNKNNVDCGECIHEDKDCIDDNLIGEERECEYGTWKSNKPCQNVSCNSDKHKCGVCKNGETRCTDNAEQKCENGDWITTTVCPLGCNWNKECKCRNDDYRCNINGSLEKCEGGTWSQSYPMNACTCKNRTDHVGVFSNNNNTSSKTYKCIHNFSCDEEGTKCGECTNETQIYGNIGSNSSYLKCKNGKWEGSMIEKPCDNDEESCIGWETSTDKFYKFKCINNKWVNIDVCQEEGCQNCWGDVT